MQIKYLYLTKILKSNQMEAETKQVKVVFPNTLNNHDTLFGGTAMQ
jgi:acyl-CoA hydrolase